jgi:hypothetical protein
VSDIWLADSTAALTVAVKADLTVVWLAVLSVEMLVGLKADQTVDLLDVSMVFRLAV